MQAAQHDLVLRVNELFHDLEGEGYEDVHPEIFEREKSRWLSLLRRYLPSAQTENYDKPFTLLDLGAGTGFVGGIVLPFMQQQNSRLISADISQEMLRVCKEKLEPIAGKTALQFLKMKDESIDLPDVSVDVVTMNSVLHHIPDYRHFLREIERVLKPGGIVFIGHEPNFLFMKHTFLRTQANFIHHLTPKRIAAFFLKKAGLYGKVVPQAADDPVLRAINEQLKKEGYIEKPLSRGILSSLIDIHSYTAGGLHENRGFDPTQLGNTDMWNGMQCIHIETYNHLLKMSGNRFWKPYGALLKALFPRRGSIFFAILHKDSQEHTDAKN